MIDERGSFDNSSPEAQQSPLGPEQSKEAIQHAIDRIEKEQKKASETRWQIRKQKKEDIHMATFLTFLLQTLESDKIIISLHKVFFSEDTGGAQVNVNHKVIIWFFAPFYQDEIEQYWLNPLYHELIQWSQLSHQSSSIKLSSYIEYLKKVSYTYHNNFALDQQQLLQLIINILLHFEVIDVTQLKDEQKKELIISITQDLFGIQYVIDVKKVTL